MPSKITGVATSATWMGIVLLGLSASMLAGPIASQTANSIQHGVYTAHQARQGKTLYGKQCATCHGDALQGKGQNPPLTGSDFLNNWQGQTLGDLYTQMHSTMPATMPGSLTPAETVQLLAYILEANKFPSGKAALPADPVRLKAIHIDAPQARP